MGFRMRLLGYLLIFIFLFLGEVRAEREIRFSPSPRGQFQILERELAWKKPDRTQAQTWVFWAWSRDGTFITAFFICSRFLMVTRFGVQMTIYRPGMKPHYEVRDYTLDRVSASEKFLFIKIDDRHIWSGSQKGGRIRVDFGKWGFMVRYLRKIPGFRTFEGPMVLGNKVFDGIQFAPRLEVRGRLKIDGREVPFEGEGYADYSYQTIIPKRLARRWYAARGFGGEYTVIASQLWATERWRPVSVPSLAVGKGGKWLFISRPDEVKFIASHKVLLGGYRVPQRVLLKGRGSDGESYLVRIFHRKEVARIDLLGHINPVLRFIVGQLLSRPYVFRYRTEFDLRIKRGKKLFVRKKLLGFSEWLFVQ